MVYKYCLGKICNRFIKNYDARKQKVYMSTGLINSISLSGDIMSSRLNILKYYLTSFYLSDNKSFSEGEMIEIVLSMLPAVWINFEYRVKSYEHLIDHLDKIESSLPDESIPKKLKSKDAHESISTSILKKEKPD